MKFRAFIRSLADEGRTVRTGTHIQHPEVHYVKHYLNGSVRPVLAGSVRIKTGRSRWVVVEVGKPHLYRHGLRKEMTHTLGFVPLDADDALTAWNMTRQGLQENRLLDGERPRLPGMIGWAKYYASHDGRRLHIFQIQYAHRTSNEKELGLHNRYPGLASELAELIFSRALSGDFKEIFLTRSFENAKKSRTEYLSEKAVNAVSRIARKHGFVMQGSTEHTIRFASPHEADSKAAGENR